MKILTVVLLFAATACATPASPLTQRLLEKLKNSKFVAPVDSSLASDAFDGNFQSRIVDGENAAARAAPYLASLSLSSLVYTHHCGCVIIGKEWLLTVAHCVQELKEMQGDVIGLPVYAGLTDRNQLEDAQVRHIDFAFQHKRFNGKEGSDDIALLHISKPFEFNVRVRQVALPYLFEEYTGEQSVTYGWGLNDPDAAMYAKELQMARGVVLNATDCRAAMPKDAPVADVQICAMVSACFGDGGSPLVVEQEGTAELAGITSWGYLPCGYSKRPTVYTAVAHYIDWIAEVQHAYYVLH